MKTTGTFYGAALLIAAFALVFAGKAAAEGGKPNILFIFADDQCYETVHALGNAEIRTPNLDRLVRGGVTFTHAFNQGSYSPAVCVASRAMLNTGRYLWRARKVHDAAEKEREAGRFWSEYMKKAGYDTYMTGKWHVKARAERAFDHVTHVRPGMPNQTPDGYNRPHEGRPDPWKPWDTKFGGFWQGGRHWSEVLGDDAVAFIEAAADREEPFFMYLAFNAPHDPRQSPKEYVDRYPLEGIKVPINYLPEYPFKDAIACGRNLRDEKLAPFPRTEYAVKVNRQEYYAIITHMDAQVGRILDSLESSGKAENTWIFFAADHGLAVGHHGLLGKQNLFDHSVRVPLMVKGPGAPPGKRIATPVYLQDIMPATLELAGVRRPDHVQFKSLMPLVRGDAVRPYDAIYGAYLDVQRSVQQDGYKLLLYPKIRKVLLFHVKDDPHEMTNLADDPAYGTLIGKLFARLLELQEETGDELDLKSVYPELQRRRAGVRVESVRRVFDNGEHNAFTDLCRFNGRFYLTFRTCPDGHGVHPTSSIIVLASDDGRAWNEVHRFRVDKRDVRDPHFLVFREKLFVYTGAWYCGDRSPKHYEMNDHLGYAAWTDNGTAWRSPVMLEGTYGHYVWRAATHRGKAYLCARRKREFAVSKNRAERDALVESAILESDDGLVWRKVGLFQERYGDETAFLFEDDGSVLAVARSGGGRNAQICRARSPYERFHRTDLDRHVGGPLLAKWGERYLVGGRKTIGKAVTSLYWLVDDRLEEFAELPSGGDNSYPGFIELSPTRALVSYYSSHEHDESGRTMTNIYMGELSRGD